MLSEQSDTTHTAQQNVNTAPVLPQGVEIERFLSLILSENTLQALSPSQRGKNTLTLFDFSNRFAPFSLNQFKFIAVKSYSHQTKPYV
jgi:hypothetical protein